MADINPVVSVSAVITKFNSSLAAKFSALEAAYNDGVSLPEVDAYWRSPQVRYPGSVNIVVVPESTEPINSPDQRQQHNLIVEVIVAGQQTSTTSTLSATELLTTRLWRVVEAIQDLINKTNLDSADVSACFVTRADATEIGQDGTRYEQRALIELIIFV